MASLSSWYLHTTVVCSLLSKLLVLFPERARAASLVVGVPTAIGALALVGATYVFTDLFNSVLAIVCFALAIVFFLISWGATRTRNTKWGFVFSSLTVISVTAAYLLVCSLASWFLL